MISIDLSNCMSQKYNHIFVSIHFILHIRSSILDDIHLKCMIQLL